MAAPQTSRLPDPPRAADAERLLRLAQFSTDRSPDPIFWIGPSGEILYVNDAVCRVLGVTRDDLVGKTVSDIDPNFPADTWADHWAELKAKGTLTFESDHWTKDGRLLRTEVTANLLVHEGHEYNCAIMRDISERKATEEILRRQLEQLSALNSLAERLNASSGLEDMYDATMDGFQRALGVDRMAILLRDSDGVTRFKAWRDVSAGYRRAVEGHTFWAPDEAHPHPVATSNVTTEVSLGAMRQVLVDEGILAFIAVPLVARGRLIGKCMLYFGTPRSLSAGERRLAQTIAGHVAFAVERKHSGDAIWASTHLLRAIVDATPDAIFVKDVNGAYQLFNPAAGRFVGRRPDEALGLTDTDLFPEPEAERSRASDRDVLERRETVTWEEVMAMPDGRRLTFVQTKGPLFDEQGEVLGVFGIARDVSAYKHVQAQLRRGEARFRSLLQNSSDITTLIGADGTILYESPAFSRLTGWQDADAVGRSVWEFLHPDDLLKAQMTFAAAVADPSSTQTVDVRFRRADGSYLTIEAAGNSRIDDPDIGGVVVNSRDVTERQRLSEQLRQSQKMEAIGRLAGGIAHDFNNLLTVIEGYTAALLEEPHLDDDVRGPIEEIQRAGSRAAQLTSQLLAFGRRRAFHPSPIELNATVTSLATMMRRLIGENIHLETHLSAEPCFVRLDVSQLEQVVLNLAINARDAMPDGGSLTIATGPGAEASFATLIVRDNGCGMDAVTVSHVFEPFFTTKEHGHGTGLGMATVYGIVTQSGGTIDVDSVVGRGTTFTITFPRVDAATSASLPAVPPPAIAHGAETVLLVEDEEQVRRFVHRVLAGWGYRVLEAADGETALALCGDAGSRIDLLLTDVVMPGINGRVLAERLTEQRPDLKVIFMTGYTEDRALDGGPDSAVLLIRKPFAPDALARLVRRALTSASD